MGAHEFDEIDVSHYTNQRLGNLVISEHQDPEVKSVEFVKPSASRMTARIWYVQPHRVRRSDYRFEDAD